MWIKPNGFSNNILFKEDNELAELIKPTGEKGIEVADEFIAKVCSLIKERATFVSDLWEVGQYFYQAPQTYDTKTIKKKWKEDSAEVLNAFIESTESLNIYDAASTHQVFQDILTN